MRRHRHVLTFLALLLIALAAVGWLRLPSLHAQAPSAAVVVAAEARPSPVVAGTRVTYSVTLGNGTDVPLAEVALRHTLPAGFDLVPGSTRMRANGLAVPAGDPSMSGPLLLWEGLTVPVGRAGTVMGMHTFVQDACDREACSIAYQLTRVRELMEADAYVKQGSEWKKVHDK